MSDIKEKLLRHFRGMKPPSVKQMIFWGIGLVLAIALFIFLRGFVACWRLTPIPGVPPASCYRNTGDQGTSDGSPVPGLPTTTPTLVAPVAELPPPWDGTSRITVLALGLDYRDWEAEIGAPRTDTMMLLTIDPLTKTAGMLSIPRDLWVSIPDFGYGKINTAFSLGEAYRLPGGGPALAMRTVEELLGVPITYYVRLDFFAFERFIDEIGGVIVEVKETIILDPIGGRNDRVTVEPGIYSLPGNLALAYARNRSSEDVDIDRAERQQQIILAIRNRLVEPAKLPYLIARAPSLYEELSAGIETNMPLDLAIRLAVLALDISLDDIDKGIIDFSMAEPVKSSQGDSLRPFPDQIRILRDEIFTTGGALGPLAAGELSSLVQSEQSRIAILNGSSYVGLAALTADYLTTQGMNVVIVGNVSEYLNLIGGVNPQGLTTIIDHAGKPYTMKYLAGLMNLISARIYSQLDLASQADVVIILGDDWGATNPIQ